MLPHPGDDAITPTQGDGHKSVVEHLGGAPEMLVAASSHPLGEPRRQAVYMR